MNLIIYKQGAPVEIIMLAGISNGHRFLSSNLQRNICFLVKGIDSSQKVMLAYLNKKCLNWKYPQKIIRKLGHTFGCSSHYPKERNSRPSDSYMLAFFAGLCIKKGRWRKEKEKEKKRKKKEKNFLEIRKSEATI